MDTTTPTPSFASLGLSEATLRVLAESGWSTPTPIQQRAIPPALTGSDVIGCAATGTGKTGAFLIPIVERMPAGRGATALVLAPTRELAVQIGEHAERLGGARNVPSAVLIGGVGMGPQTEALKRARLVIATPGRLLDHVQQGTARLDGIQVLVLDEADRMLDMGFKPQLDRILNRLPKKRQTLLFSATMAGEVADFAARACHQPVRVEVARSGTTAARASQVVFLVPQEQKTALLLSLLADSNDSTLVFTRTKRRADKVTKVLARAHHAVERIHADRSQSQRQKALEGFREGVHRVLVATDIAARGIDVAEIGHVVNYDLPHVAEDYVHRVGRTARASASGRASAFCAPDEMELLQAIEKLRREKVPRSPLPVDSKSFQDALAFEAERVAQTPPVERGHGVSQRAPGQQPGRHARSHPKKATTARGVPRQQGAGPTLAPKVAGEGPRKSASVFSGRPRGRR